LPGPYEHRTALDEVVQMMGGLAYMTGRPGDPLRAGSSVNDIMGGMFGAIGAIGALIQRGITGKGQEVQSALFENNVFLVGQHMLQYAITGKPAAPMPARISAWAVYDVFTVKDGEQIFLAAVSDAQWATFCDALGFDDLKVKPEFQTNNQRVQARPTLMPLLRERLAQHRAAALAALFEKVGLPFAPIRKPEELYDDEHLLATGGLADITLPDGERAGQTAQTTLLPFTMDGQRLGVRLQPPRKGEHTAELLRAMAQAAGTVKFILPNATGSGVDAITRAAQPALAKALGASVVVDNQPGAGGVVGLQALARSAPDGNTLSVVSNNVVIFPSVLKALPFDMPGDFTPIAVVGSTPMVLVVNPAKVAATNSKEFIALLKSKPGQLNFASGGNGTILHLAAEMFLDEAGVTAKHIPYKGVGRPAHPGHRRRHRPGSAMAERFLSLGADVAICGRRKAVCDETAAPGAQQFPAGASTPSASTSASRRRSTRWSSRCGRPAASPAWSTTPPATSSRPPRACRRAPSMPSPTSSSTAASTSRRRWASAGWPRPRPAPGPHQPFRSVMSIITTWVDNGSPTWCHRR
jgi:hypothetical protein